MHVANFGQRSNILGNKGRMYACRVVAYVHWSSGRPLRTISHPYSAEKHMETHPYSHFRRTTSISSPFSQTRESGMFTRMTLRLDDMLIHNLTHLFNVVGQIVCLKLMSKAPIQHRKRLSLYYYRWQPNSSRFGRKTKAVKNFCEALLYT